MGHDINEKVDVEQCVPHFFARSESFVPFESTSKGGGPGPPHLLRGDTRWFLTLLIIVLGLGVSGAFLSLGIKDEKESSELEFEQSAMDIAAAIKVTWLEYEILASWAHDSCHRLVSSIPANSTELNDILHMCTREEFRNIYEQISDIGKGLYALQYVPKVEDQYRVPMEDASRAWLAQTHPQIDYQGFGAMNWADEGATSYPAPRHDFYYPIHLLEPFEGNEAVFDVDVYDSEGGARLIDSVLEAWEPKLSPPTRLAQEKHPDFFSVFLTHPGEKTSVFGENPHSLIAAVVRIPNLLEEAAYTVRRCMTVYLYDSTMEEEMLFLGGMQVDMRHDGAQITPLRELAYQDIPLPRRSKIYQTSIHVVDRQWTVVVAPYNGSDAPHLTFIILGAGIIFFIFLLLAVTLKRHLERIDVINKIQAEANQAASAQKQVQRERRLNEYLAHEVRNPLASAMAALSFVSEHTMAKVEDEETRQLILGDTQVVDSSLNYINDLLRSMLDINRAKSGLIKINNAPTDILHDILEPAAAILCVRGARVELKTECTKENLGVYTDRLRLKQIILNLSINATKFVQQGYIRLRADVVNGSVMLFVEDTGPGVPIEKRDVLFESFQESLDLLNQGTGIGLSICHDLCELMGATIKLDPSYDSGVPNSPGACFVVDLKKSPIQNFGEGTEEATTKAPKRESGEENLPPKRLPSVTLRDNVGAIERSGESTVSTVATNASETGQDSSYCEALPGHLEVMFVDDESILRKLFIRTVRKVAPTWRITEASSGDRALQLAQTKTFDLIFMDQYMPGIERPLLGTEVVRNLRAMGVTSRICGLSANDLELDFLEAGANYFLQKPFPCQREKLHNALMEFCGTPT